MLALVRRRYLRRKEHRCLPIAPHDPLADLLDLQNHRLYLLRYAIVGVANTIIYGCLIWLFLHSNIFPRFLSVAFSFVIAMTFQYTANRAYTFRSKKAKTKEISKYLLAAAITYALTLVMIWICLDLLSMSEKLAALLSAGITAVFSYCLSSSWVYRQ